MDTNEERERIGNNWDSPADLVFEYLDEIDRLRKVAKYYADDTTWDVIFGGFCDGENPRDYAETAKKALARKDLSYASSDTSGHGSRKCVNCGHVEPIACPCGDPNYEYETPETPEAE